MSISSQLPPILLSQTSPTLHALAQTAGGTVEATVIGQQPSGLTQVQIGRQALNLQLPAPAMPGSVLTLALQQASGQVRVALIATTLPPVVQAGGQAQTPTSVELSAAARAYVPGPQAVGAPGSDGGRTMPGVTPSVAQAHGAAAAPDVLTQMMQRDLPRQDSVLGLMMALSRAVGRVTLPEPVIRAAMQVLSQQTTLDGATLDGTALRRAVLNSGLFQEAMLAAGQPQTAGADLKTALLGLQRELAAWLGNQAPLARATGAAPPLRGVLPRAKAPPATLADLPEDPSEVGKHLFERTEAALSRLRLHQGASLPEPAQRHEGQWSMDLPVTIAGLQNVLQLQIHHDPDEGERREEGRGWQVRLAINLGAAGEVGAQISLRGKAAGVLIWAEDAKTAEMLNGGVAELRSELEASGLQTGAVFVRAAAPAAHVVPERHFLDEER